MTENQLAVETGLSRGAVKTGTRRLLEKGLVSTWTQGNQIPVYIISELGQEHFETVTGEYQ